MTGGTINKYINRDSSYSYQFEDKSRSKQMYLQEGTIKTSSTMPSSDDCGLVFESAKDLARHMNR